MGRPAAESDSYVSVRQVYLDLCLDVCSIDLGYYIARTEVFAKVSTLSRESLMLLMSAAHPRHDFPSELRCDSE